jgi:Domain of unknown function (DUF5655)
MKTDLIGQHMDNGTPESRAMYLRLLEILDVLGTYTIHPAKSTITFKGSNRGFCGAHPKKDKLVGYFDLTRALPSDQRLSSVSPYTKKLFVHQFRLKNIEEMDQTFISWIEEAFAVGNGRHLIN